MLKEKSYIIQKLSSILSDMDVDTVQAFYLVATKLSKGGNYNDNRRKKSQNHSDHNEN